MDEPTLIDFIFRLGGAVAFGAVLGFDRERLNKPAGLRTHAMVCMGAATFALLTIHVFLTSMEAGADNPDMIRLIDGIVGGIGFLGAGTIIQSRGDVKGITTAASIWVAGAVGVACGLGRFDLAIVATIASLAILIGLRIFERNMDQSDDNDD